MTKPKCNVSEAKKDFHFAVPRPALSDIQLSRTASTSTLMDLSTNKSQDRGLAALRLVKPQPHHPRPLLQASASSNGVSLLKRALQPESPGSAPPRSKTVVTLMPPSSGGLYRASTM